MRHMYFLVGDEVCLLGTDLVGKLDAVDEPLGGDTSTVHVEWTNGTSDNGPDEWIDGRHLVLTDSAEYRRRVR